MHYKPKYILLLQNEAEKIACGMEQAVQESIVIGVTNKKLVITRSGSTRIVFKIKLLILKHYSLLYFS
jgi:hypothetical protein